MILWRLFTDVTWNLVDESLAARATGQPRGACLYPNNLDSITPITDISELLQYRIFLA